MMKEKFPHLYEYGRRCKLISEDDGDYWSEFKDKICREHMEVHSNWMERYKLGGNEEIHKVEG